MSSPLSVCFLFPFLTESVSFILSSLVVYTEFSPASICRNCWFNPPDDVRRVYDFTDFRRIFIERAQNFPVLLPALHAGGILRPTALRKSPQFLCSASPSVAVVYIFFRSAVKSFTILTVSASFLLSSLFVYREFSQSFLCMVQTTAYPGSANPGYLWHGFHPFSRRLFYLLVEVTAPGMSDSSTCSNRVPRMRWAADRLPYVCLCPGSQSKTIALPFYSFSFELTKDTASLPFIVIFIVGGMFQNLPSFLVMVSKRVILVLFCVLSITTPNKDGKIYLIPVGKRP